MSYTNPGPATTTGSTDIGLGGPITVGTEPETLVAFHGATPIAQQTVTGAIDDGTALTNLLAALEAKGLIVDATTPT